MFLICLHLLFPQKSPLIEFLQKFIHSWKPTRSSSTCSPKFSSSSFLRVPTENFLKVPPQVLQEVTQKASLGDSPEIPLGVLPKVRLYAPLGVHPEASVVVSMKVSPDAALKVLLIGIPGGFLKVLLEVHPRIFLQFQSSSVSFTRLTEVHLGVPSNVLLRAFPQVFLMILSQIFPGVTTEVLQGVSPEVPLGVPNFFFPKIPQGVTVEGTLVVPR